jgi:diguanylate cyclase
LRGDRETLGADIYREIIVYLYATVWPLVVIGCGYLGLALVAFDASRGNRVLAVIGVVGTLVAFARVVLVLLYRRQPPESRDAARWERYYLSGAFVFSACLGLLEAKIFLCAPPVEPFGIALLYAYGAGVAARVCVRPRIAIGSLMLAVPPAIAGMIASANLASFCLAAFTVLFMSGAFETVFSIYKSLVANLKLRYEFASLARQDDLTGLPNRLVLRESLSREIARVMRHGGLVAVHYLDLDNFKLANDKFGHPTGDILLRQVAERLQRLLRLDDVIGRLGGDEFLVIQTGIVHRSEAEVLAMRIIRALNLAFDIGGKDIIIGGSIGIALAPSDATDISMLIKLADRALYEAKSRGRSRYAFHEDRQEEASKDGNAIDAPHSASA